MQQISQLSMPRPSHCESLRTPRSCWKRRGPDFPGRTQRHAEVGRCKPRASASPTRSLCPPQTRDRSQCIQFPSTWWFGLVAQWGLGGNFFLESFSLSSARTRGSSPQTTNPNHQLRMPDGPHCKMVSCQISPLRSPILYFILTGLKQQRNLSENKHCKELVSF